MIFAKRYLKKQTWWKFFGVFASLVCYQFIFGIQTHVINDSGYARLSEGTLTNLSLGIQGEIKAAPGIEKITTLDESLIWKMLPDAEGTGLWIATGNKGKLYHWDPEKGMDMRFDPDSVIGRGLAVANDGSVFYGTSPRGAIYHISEEKKPEIYFDPDNTYLWDFLLVDDVLWVAAGQPAQLWRVPMDGGEPEVWFSAKDDHFTRVIQGDDGQLYLGTEGNGMVYEVTGQGEGRGIFQTPEEEIRDMALGKNGNLWIAAFEGSEPGKSPNNGNANTGNAKNGNARAEFEAAMGLEPGATRNPDEAMKKSEDNGKGVLYQRNNEGFIFPVWTSSKSGISSLAKFGSKYWMVGLNQGGELYAVEERDVWHKALELEDGGEVSAITPVPGKEGRFYIATSNPAAVYRLGGRNDEPGIYESEIRDATQMVRWGNIEVVVEDEPEIDVSVRTGNTPQPDDTWYDWKNVQGNVENQMWRGEMEQPPSRFLQYKLRMKGDDQAKIHRIRSFVQLPNAAPVIKEVRSVPLLLEPQRMRANGRLLDFNSIFQGDNLERFMEKRRERLQFHPTNERDARTFFWQAEDPNDDSLRFDVHLIPESSGERIVIDRNLSDPFAVIMTSGLPDGFYRVRITASDSLDNPGGSELSGEHLSEPFLIDHGSPKIQDVEIEADEEDLLLAFEVEDSWSVIKEATVRIEGGDPHNLQPEDRIFDSRHEKFVFRIQDRAEEATGIQITTIDESGREATSALNWKP